MVRQIRIGDFIAKANIFPKKKEKGTWEVFRGETKSEFLGEIVVYQHKRNAFTSHKVYNKNNVLILDGHCRTFGWEVCLKALLLQEK